MAYQESIWKSAHDDGCHTELANPSGELTATPAFGVFTAFFCLWLAFDHDWHAVATCATLAITLFIKRAEHRDTQAIHAKLDELLRAHDKQN